MQSYTANLMASFDPYHSSSLDIDLPTHLAMVSMTRPIRHLLRRQSSFVAAFVLPPNGEVHSFKMAAKYLLESSASLDGNKSNCFVLVVDEESDLSDEFSGFRKLRDLKRAIILLEDHDLLTSEVHISADIVVSLPSPCSTDYQIVVRRMGLGKLSKADADFLASLSPKRVELGLRRNRSLQASLGRLRQYPQTGQPRPSSDTVPAGPTLHDLAGYGDAKAWGIELADDLVAWKAGMLPWSNVECGILLSGPPGSGKTSYAAALARTCNAKLILASAARWQARGHLGDLLEAMRKAFSEAAAQAPSVLLIDEFDSFTSREDRTGSSDNYHRQVVNGLLELLDGAQIHEGVIIVGATNYPKIIDPALLRAGRLERHFTIPLPDERGREDIFRFYLGEELAHEPLETVVLASEGWSGADIERCVRDARRHARKAKRSMLIGDLAAAMPPVIPVPLAVRRCVAAHELGHAILGVLLETEPLVAVSIEKTVRVDKSTQTMGTTVFEEQHFNRRTAAHFRDKIAVLLGGVAAEEMLFKDFENSGGGDLSADLNRATDIATMLEVTWGLGKTLTVEPDSSPRALAGYRHQRRGVAKSVEATLKQEFARAKLLLEEHRSVLLDLHAKLVREGTLSADVVKAAVRAHRESRVVS